MFRSIRAARLCVILWAVVLSTSASAHEYRSGDDERQRVTPLVEALRLNELLGIMRREGTGYAVELNDDLFPDRGRERWTALVTEIYDLGRMKAVMLDEMAARLSASEIEGAFGFFSSETGQKIISLELSAREVLQDPSVKAASRDAFIDLKNDDAARLSLLMAFAEVNDLIEMNVAGSLNANYAFFDGLNRAGAFGDRLSESDILSDVWREEPSIRSDAEVWMTSFLSMAYGPLSDADIIAYTEFSDSSVGQALNAALFGAFDVLYTQISRELGMAAAQFMTGEDL